MFKHFEVTVPQTDIREVFITSSEAVDFIIQLHADGILTDQRPAMINWITD